MIGVRANQDDVGGLSGQHANYIGRQLALQRLLCEIGFLAPRVRQPLPDQRFAFIILGRERLQVPLNRLARHQAILNLRTRPDSATQANEQGNRVA